MLAENKESFVLTAIFSERGTQNNFNSRSTGVAPVPIATLNFQSHTHAYPSKINLPSDWNRVSLASQPFTKTNISYASRKSNIQKHDAVLCCSFLFRSVPLRACSAPRSQESHVPGRDRVINRPKGGTPKRGRFLGGTFRLSAATRAKLVFKAVIIYR